MVEMGCGPIHSPVSHLAWLFPVPNEHVLAERRPTGLLSSLFPDLSLIILYFFIPPLAFGLAHG